MKYALIMAGGAGTRLWPMSTKQIPKQLVPLFSGKSLLDMVVDRLDGFIDPQRVLICTGEKYRPAIRAAMPRIGDEQIIGEPEGRDTLAAVGVPAAILARRDPDAVMAVLTSDQIIEPTDLFQQRFAIGCKLVEKHPDALVTFGIEPTSPRTTYGYVRIGSPIKGFDHAYKTAEFKEKPDLATAQQYLDDADGSYLWNSGMFVWRAKRILELIASLEPEAYEGMLKIAEAWDTPRRADVLAEVYPTLRKISVDYAIMEPAARDGAVRMMTVSLPVRWMDVGSWPAYGSLVERDGEGNQSAGARVVSVDTKETIVVSGDGEHLIATLGVSDLVVVHTPRVTLICHREAAEDLKLLRKAVRKAYGEHYL